MAGIKEVSCRRVRNLGNYETETAEFVAVLDEGEDAIAVYDALKQNVLAGLGYRKERMAYEEKK